MLIYNSSLTRMYLKCICTSTSGLRVHISIYSTCIIPFPSLIASVIFIIWQFVAISRGDCISVSSTLCYTALHCTYTLYISVSITCRCICMYLICLNFYITSKSFSMWTLCPMWIPLLLVHIRAISISIHCIHVCISVSIIASPNVNVCWLLFFMFEIFFLFFPQPLHVHVHVLVSWVFYIVYHMYQLLLLKILQNLCTDRYW